MYCKLNKFLIYSWDYQKKFPEILMLNKQIFYKYNIFKNVIPRNIILNLETNMLMVNRWECSL